MKKLEKLNDFLFAVVIGMFLGLLIMLGIFGGYYG
jgi:hypothetical protein